MRVLIRLSNEALNRLPRERESILTWLRTDSVADRFLRNSNNVTHCQLAPNANGQAEAEAVAKLVQQLELYMDSITDWNVIFADLVGNGESSVSRHVDVSIDIETMLLNLSLLHDADKIQDFRCIGSIMEWSNTGH